ncbi:hypothetical protein ACHAWC_011238 [Mediolabrus comicus]
MNVNISRVGYFRTRPRWEIYVWTGFILSVIWFVVVKHKIVSSSFPVDTRSKENSCLISFGTYRGIKFESHSTDSNNNSGEETIGNKCLIESPWMRLAQHTVQIVENNRDKSNVIKVIDDWLFIDYHDRINVLVQDPDSSQNDTNPSFLILKQTKYALSSQQSLAVVGGIVEPGEEPLVAAKREVSEELLVSCNSWTSLGKYRTDVNRGMGWVHPFLARDCVYTKTTLPLLVGDTESNGNVGAHDIELQNKQSMTLNEVKDAVMKERFVEVQWSNTVALAMLHLI